MSFSGSTATCAMSLRFQVYVMWTFPSLYRLGVPPRVLARWYGNPR